MKFMITWKIPPASYKEAIGRFLKTAAKPPAGLKTVGRWHTAGSTSGFHLVEGTEAALMEHAAECGRRLSSQHILMPQLAP